MRSISLLLSRVFAHRSVGLLLACALGVLLADVGCTPDTRAPGTDSGIRPLPTDSGIRLSDSGPVPGPRDSGIRLRDSGPPPPPPPRDAGPPPPPPRDAGPPPPPPGACRLDSFTQLPAACLPRCAAATESAAIACTDGDCFSAVLQADPTPPVTLTLPDGSTTSLDCEGCAVQQIQSCWFEFCPSQWQALIECDELGGVCTVERDTLNTCRSGSAVVDCENGRLALCFF